MTKLKRINQACAITLAMGLPGVAFAADAPAGQLLFVSGVVKIVDAAGKERPAKKGDGIAPGERIVTDGGAMGQIKMSDGSLIGVRHDSDLKVDKLNPGGSQGPDERVMFLSKGAVRIVNVENGDKEKHLPVLLQTPTATIGLRNADNESIVVPAPLAGGGKPANDPGTYSRMAVGGGVIKTTGGESSLAINQVTFAPTGGTALPTTIAMMPDTMIRSIPAVSPVPVAGGGTTTLPDKISAPVGPITGSPLPIAIAPAGMRPPSITAPVTLMLNTPIAIAPISPIIIQPVKPPTLVNTGTIDVKSLPPATIATLPTAILMTLPPATLATLPTATLVTLPPETLATLPPKTINTLPPTLQTTVLATQPAKTPTTTLQPIKSDTYLRR